MSWRAGDADFTLEAATKAVHRGETEHDWELLARAWSVASPADAVKRMADRVNEIGDPTRNRGAAANASHIELGGLEFLSQTPARSLIQVDAGAHSHPEGAVARSARNGVVDVSRTKPASRRGPARAGPPGIPRFPGNVYFAGVGDERSGPSSRRGNFAAPSHRP